jgi:hypothetical protein
MRRPHRNIEIFSMSVLDMFASALGAFIMCAIILMPSYKKSTPQDLEKSREELKSDQHKLFEASDKTKKLSDKLSTKAAELAGLRRTKAELTQCRAGVNVCQAEATKNFLLVKIDWDEQVGVDLHVTDPAGNDFYWNRTNRAGRDFPESKAQLSFYVAIGPGIAVWVDPSAKPGVYQVDYVLHRQSGDRSQSDVVVRGVVFDRNGRTNLSKKRIRMAEQRVKATTIRISNDGSAAIQ